MRPGAAKGNAGSFALHRKKTKFSLKTKKNKQKQNTNARSKSTKRIPIWYSPSAMHLKIWFWVFSSVFFLPHQKQNRFHFFRVFFCFFFFVRLPRGRRWPSTIGRCAGPDENAIKKQMSPGLPIEEKRKRFHHHHPKKNEEEPDRFTGFAVFSTFLSPLPTNLLNRHWLLPIFT